MIKTYLSVQIGDATFTFNGVRRDLTPGTDAAARAAVDLLRSAADALDAAIEPEFTPGPGVLIVPDSLVKTARFEDGEVRFGPVDENGNRQCYLCGFFHDEPGSCANGTPTNITPGPDDEPEYDGPTDDDSDRFLAAGNDDGWDGPESGDYIEPREPDWPEEGDYSPVQIMPPYVDKELQAERYDDDECAAANRPIADIVRERIGRSVVQASKRDEADQ